MLSPQVCLTFFEGPKWVSNTSTGIENRSRGTSPEITVLSMPARVFDWYHHVKYMYV
jgi:hypothetical protein